MKEIRYLQVKGKEILIKSTYDFASLLEKEFGFYDSRDWLFDEARDIRVFVRDLSIYSQRPIAYYYYRGNIEDIFCGTLIFAKMGKNDFRSLSKKDISLLKRRLLYSEKDKRYNIYS